MTKEQIIREIKRLAKNGKPPGWEVFKKETGLQQHKLHLHFLRWSDAVTEPGFEPNKWQGKKRSSDELLRMYAEIVRHFARVPILVELTQYTRRRNRQDIPFVTTFTRRFQNKTGLDAALAKWVRENDEFADLAALLPEPPEPKEDDASAPSPKGFVYLFKFNRLYKIGWSAQPEQRLKQINATSPVGGKLVHKIQTDDPQGIERYWHRRFKAQRANNEFFRLSGADVRAFKKQNSQWVAP